MMEAPSPAPVLIAEPIDKIKFIIDDNDKTINITLLNNNDRFNKVINIDDDFWKKNKIFYQDSFELFKKSIKDTLIKRILGMTFTMVNLDKENVNLQLNFEKSLFPFTTEIILVKILSENEALKKVKCLLKENKELKEEIILNTFYKKILYLIIIIIITIIIISIYLNDIFNNYKSELNNVKTNLTECKNQLSEIDSLNYICEEKLNDCLDDFKEESESLSEYKCALLSEKVDPNQIDLYDKNKKETRSLSLFSINIGW